MQAGNAEYNPAEATATTIVIKRDQTIDFTLADTYFVNDVIDLTAIAESGLDITYEIVSGDATLDTDAMTITPNSEGSVTVKASQAGNYEYNPAADVTLTFNVVKRDQTIDFTLADTYFVNDVIDLTAIAESGLDITYEIVSGDATLDTDAMTITPNSEGSVTVKASQAGNYEYNPAADVTLTFNVVNAIKQSTSLLKIHIT